MNKRLVAILAVSLAIIGGAVFAPPAGAWPACGSFEVTKSSDYSTSDGGINLQDYDGDDDRRVTITGSNGWSISFVGIDYSGNDNFEVSFGSQASPFTYTAPNNQSIDNVQVTWVKECPSPPTATPLPSTPTPTEEEHKTWICHVPPGNPENSHAIEVDESGWNGHDNHEGDFELTGPDDPECPPASPTPTPTEPPTEEPTEEPTDEPTPEPTEEPTQEPTPEPTDTPTITRVCVAKVIGYLFHLIGPEGQEADFASFSERGDGTWYIPNTGSQQRCLGWIAVNAPWGREITIDCNGNVSVKLTRCEGGGCAEVYKD